MTSISEAENKIEVVADIDLNNIFYQLHEIAKNEALKSKNGYDLINFSISEEKKTFVGACDSVITVTIAEKELPKYLADYEKLVDKVKDECYDILKTYILFFVGEKQSNELDKEQLLAIEKIQENNESIKIDYSKSLLENLFEAEDDMDPDSERSQEDYDALQASADASAEDADLQTTADTENSDNNNNEEKTTVTKYIIGYSIQYQCDYAGEKRTSLQKILLGAASTYKNFTLLRGLLKGSINITGKAIKSLFGALANTSLVRDLSKLSFGTFGGHKLNIGQAATKAVKTAGKVVANTAKAVSTVAKLAGKTFGKLDFADIIKRLQDKCDSKYHDNKLVIEPIKTTVIEQLLKQQGKFNSSISDIIKRTKPEYVIGIMAKKADKYYKNYSIDNFKKIYDSAVNPATNVWTRAPIKKDNIVKIVDFKPNNVVLPDNIEDKNESLECKVNNFMNMMFEDFHDYVSISESDSELENNFKQLFFDNGKLNVENIDIVADKLDNDNTVVDEKFALKLFNTTKEKLIANIKAINNEKSLNSFVSHYQAQEKKLDYLFKLFKKYLDRSTNKVDNIVDQFIIDGKIQKSKLLHIAKMIKDDSLLTDDYFEIKSDSINIKSKKDFCDKLLSCKTKDDLYALFDNYSNPATLKLFNDKIVEYFKKNKLDKDDKVDLYLFFKKHKFEQNLKSKDSK